MGFFDMFRKERKALNPNSTSQRPIQGVLTPLVINYKQDNAYTSISSVYSVVSYLMTKFSSVPIRVYKVQDKTSLKQFKQLQPHQFQSPALYLKTRRLQTKALEQVDEKSPLANLLQQPNEYMSSDHFFQLLYGYKLLKGEGFIWGNRGEGKEGDKNAEILEMHVMPTAIMNLIPDPDDVFGLLGWVAQLPKLRRLEKDDVLLWKYPRFDFDSTTHIHMRGLSPLTAGNDDLEGISYLNEAYKSIFKNKGANGLLMAKEGDVTTDQVSKIITAINERINGSDKAGSIAGGAGVYDFFNLSMGARDMQLIEAKKFSVTQVAQLYNVPAGIWDLSESANNNITQYRAQVYTDKLISEWCSLLSQLNTWLLPAFGMDGGYYIAADYSEIPDLQADLQRMVDGIKDAPEITFNEKRELRGYERDDNPLMDTFWVNSNMKPIDDAAINIDMPTNLPNDMGGATAVNS